MKHLKIFEEFKVGTLYTAKVDDSNTTQIEIDGYPVKIINREDSPGCQSLCAYFSFKNRNNFIRRIMF
jgi:hypothetical protein